LVKIDGKKLVELSRRKEQISFKDLILCLANEQIVQHIIDNSQLKYDGKEGKIKAIIKI